LILFRAFLFRPQPELEETIKSQLKSVYDLAKKFEDHRDQNTVSKLIINDFDDEQIWQQIEIQNKFALPELEKRLTVYLETARERRKSHAGMKRRQNVNFLLRIVLLIFCSCCYY
jgi:hypothetical protein